MKTDKQIQLLKEKLGLEYEEKLHTLDQIEFSRATLAQALTDTDFKASTEAGESCYLPFLKNGVLNAYRKNEVYLYFFEVTENATPEQFTFSCTLLQEKDHKCLWLLEMHVDVKIHSGVIETGFRFEDATTLIYKKQNRDSSGYAAQMREQVQNHINGFLLMIAYCNYRMQQTEVIVREEKDDSKEKKTIREMTAGVKVSSKKKRVVTVDGIRIVYAPGFRNRQTYHRRTQSWSVRGHYRRYKSGKVVYVKPFQKGSGKKQAKKYQLK